MADEDAMREAGRRIREQQDREGRAHSEMREQMTPAQYAGYQAAVSNDAQRRKDERRRSFARRVTWKVGLYAAAVGLGVVAAATWSQNNHESIFWMVLVGILAGAIALQVAAPDPEGEWLQEIFTTSVMLSVFMVVGLVIGHAM